MKLLLVTELEGKTVPLADCDWVLFAACGHPASRVVAAIAPSEDLAWKEFFPRKRDRDRAHRDRYRIELVTRDRMAAEVMPAMQAGCQHAPAGRS